MILSHNPKTANCRHCPTRGCSDSVCDAPEKLRCQRVHEKVDVHVLGNMFCFLLTGLRPLHECGLEDMNGPVNGVRIGKTPFVDELCRIKDFVCSKLVTTMELCWMGKPRDRISIFQVTEMLQKVKQASKRLSIRQCSSMSILNMI
jgi:hypothetical protein